MTISLCMIVKNEAQYLPACLQSAAKLVSEIIVVDTGSSDDTVALAQQHRASIIEFDWEDDFAAARNVGLAAATGDWILVLDADERLSPEAADQIRRIDQTETNLLAVTLLRHEVGAQQSPYTLLTRLFRNRSDIRFQRPYHETVDDSLSSIQAHASRWKIGRLAGVAIEHTGYQAAAIAAVNKFQRARTIMERHIDRHPQDAYVLNKLGALYVQQGELQRGMELLQRGLDPAPSDAATRYELHYHLGLAHRSLQQLSAAEHHYQAALRQPVEDMLKLSSYLNLGSLYKQLGQLSLAGQQFQIAIAISPQWAIAYFNLGVVYRAQGKLEAAIEAYRQAILHRPDYGEAYQNLGILLYKQGRFEECVPAFQQAIDCYQRTNPQAAQKLKQGIQSLGLPRQLLAQAYLL